ncbi:MAG: DUF4419 domain-containing protein [Vulcanimicrobiota bacterium]
MSQFYRRVLDLEQPFANQLLGSAHLAFAEHRPLILSPDMIWVTLLQGLAEHLESHAEELRPLLIRSKERERLAVPSAGIIIESLETPWDEAMLEFRELIRQQLQPEAVSLATVEFSTTGPLEQAVFSIALMDAFKVYFDYEISCVCGIPEITLEGTPSDWAQLRQALQSWKRFGLDWWLEALDPILVQFQEAASGRVDPIFWNDLYQHHLPIEGGYGGPIELFSGWIARLFPYYNGQKNPALQKLQPLTQAGFRSSLSRASVLVVGADGKADLEFVAGLLAIEQRGLALRPCLGWVVHQHRSEFIEDDRQRALAQLRPEIRSGLPFSPPVTKPEVAARRHPSAQQPEPNSLLELAWAIN